MGKLIFRLICELAKLIGFCVLIAAFLYTMVRIGMV